STATSLVAIPSATNSMIRRRSSGRSFGYRPLFALPTPTSKTSRHSPLTHRVLQRSPESALDLALQNGVGGGDRRGGSGGESVADPATRGVTPVPEAVVQPARPALPELEDLGRHQVATPVRGPGHI